MHALDLAAFPLRLVSALGAAALTWWGALSFGDIFARRVAGADRAFRWPIAGAIGYAAVGSACALLSLFRVANPVLLGLMPAVLMACSWRSAFLDIPSSFAHAIRRTRDAGPINVALYCLSGAAVITSIVAAALPPVFWDPLAYHLPIVAAVVRTSTLSFDPAMTQTAFPLLAENAALPAYAIAGASGAAMATLGTGIALAWLCGAIAAVFDSRSHALVIALIACCPLMLWLGPSFYVDVPYALFAVAALAPVLAPERVDVRYVAALSGFMAGCAAAVKYPGLVVAGIALVATFLVYRHKSTHLVLRFALAFVAVAAGWYVRTAVLTGDAVYPFLTSLAPGAVGDFARRYVTMTSQWCGGGGSIADFAAMPWRMLVDPRQYCGDPGFALRLGAVLFLAGLAMWRKTQRLTIATVVLAAAWFVGSRQDRFVLPALFVYAIAVGVTAWALPVRDQLKQLLSATLGGLSAVAVASAWVPSLIGLSANSLVPSLDFIGGRESAAALLSDRLESFDSMEWVRSRLRPGERVLAVDDVRDYYLGANVAWANPYYQPVWKIDWSADPSDRYAAFRRAGFRYAIVDANKAYLGRTPTGLDLSALASDSRRGIIRLVHSSNDVEVFDLGPRKT